MNVLIISIIYQLLQIILFPFIAILICILQVKRGIIGNLKQRMGIVPKTQPHEHVIWLHAVSVGEVLSLQELVNTIKLQIPNAVCYVTVGTIAGMRMAKKQISADYLSFIPYDFGLCMLLAYKRINPKALIITESEIWPNLISFAHFKKVPLFLVNARVNPRSQNRNYHMRWFLTPLLNCFNAIFTQSTHDQEAFERMGVDQKKLIVLGNLKAWNVMGKKEKLEQTAAHQPPYNLSAVPATLSELRRAGAKAQFTLSSVEGADRPFPIILVGSMHPGELDIYLDTFTQLKAAFPNLKLMLAPRHFCWQTTLVDKIKQAGFSFFEWTETQPISKNHSEPLQSSLKAIFSHYDILLVCKLGELFGLYPYATIFALGGTFVPVGGHNLLEPAVWGTATIIGPYYDNCKDIADRLEAAEGIIKVENIEKLNAQVFDLLAHPENRIALGNKSYTWVKGEAERVEHVINKLIQKI